MLSGQRPTIPAAASEPEAVAAELQLERFLAAGSRQRLRDWPALERLGRSLHGPIWKLLEGKERQPRDWALGSLLRLIAQDDEQIKILRDRHPQGWLEAPPGGSYKELEWLLIESSFELADRLTSAELRRLAGAGAEKRGYVYFSEVAQISSADLRHLDNLWWFYGAGRFGFRVQRRLLDGLNGRWDQLWPRLGWKDAGSWTRYPGSFTWSLQAPEGHLPLVNQLRGVRLMDALLSHPAIAESQSGP
jgi:hypothetical protein